MRVDSCTPSFLRQAEASNDQCDTSQCHQPPTAVSVVYGCFERLRGGHASAAMCTWEVQGTSLTYCLHVAEDAICRNSIPDSRTGVVGHRASSKAVISSTSRTTAGACAHRPRPLTPRQARWPQFLEGYNLTLWYVAGLENPAADACCRLTSRQLMDIENATCTRAFVVPLVENWVSPEGEPVDEFLHVLEDSFSHDEEWPQPYNHLYP